MIAGIKANKNLSPIINCLSEEKTVTFHLFLYYNLIWKGLKI